MIAIAALLLAAADPLPLAELPPQKLPRGACALVLWDKSSRRRVAMALQQPAALRIVRDGAVLDLPASAAEGLAIAGFAPVAAFAGSGLSIRWQLTIEGIAGGGIVRDGSLALTLADGTDIVTPVAGLIGCN